MISTSRKGYSHTLLLHARHRFNILEIYLTLGTLASEASKLDNIRLNRQASISRLRLAPLFMLSFSLLQFLLLHQFPQHIRHTPTLHE